MSNYPQKVRQLVEMGFDREKATRAIERYHGNISQAAMTLTEEIPDVTEVNQNNACRDVVPVQGMPIVIDVPDTGESSQANMPALTGGGDRSNSGAKRRRVDVPFKAPTGTPDAQKKDDDYNPLEYQTEDPQLPKGLKNIGNTCFVNCLMQVYYHIPEFRNRMLLMERSEKMEQQVQKLFGYMAATKKKFLDTSELLAFFQKEGLLGPVVGAQEDVAEVNDKFLTALEKGSEGSKAFLNELFQYQLEESYKSKEEDGTPVNFTKQDFSSYLLVNVSAKYNSLYKSLDYLTAEESIKYTTPKEFETTAEKLTLFKKVPRVLIIALKRISFNKVSGRVDKIRDPFFFREKIFLDRYILENKKEILAKREQIRRFRLEIDMLQGQLNKLKVFNALRKENEFMFGDQLLKKAVDFLKSHPAGRDHNIVVQQLSEIQQKISDEVHSLHVQISKCQRQIEDIFELDEEFRKHQYNLHSLIIHEGYTAEMGHFYAIARKGDKWYKFNDIYVSKMNVEDVMNVSQKNLNSVYCLVYTREDLETESMQLQLDTRMIHTLKDEVVADNEKWKREMVEYIEREKKAVAEEKIKFVENYQKKTRHFIDLRRNAGKGGRNNDKILDLKIDQRIYSYPYFLLSLEDRNESFFFQVAWDTYETVIKRKAQNKFEELVNLEGMDVKILEKEQLQDDKEQYRKFIVVNQYMCIGIDAVRRENEDIRKALNSLRMALAYDNNVENEKLKQRDLIVMYAAALVTQFFEQGNQLLRSGNAHAVDYFNLFFEFVDPFLHKQFIFYLRHTICDSFFDCVDRAYLDTFSQYDCDRLNAVIDRFIYYSHSDEKHCPILKMEKPSFVEHDLTYVIPKFTLNNKTLAKNLKETMEKVNWKLYHIIGKYKSTKRPFTTRKRRAIEKYRKKFTTEPKTRSMW